MRRGLCFSEKQTDRCILSLISLKLYEGMKVVMVLWTIQHYPSYERLQKTGILRANEDYLFCADDFRYAYDWMSEKMICAGLIPPQGVKYPVWAWHQWEGRRKRRDMREGGHAKRGEKIVQLTIEINDQHVLLSDFDLFHYPLGYWYLPIDENDDSEFESRYKSLGYSFHDLSDLSIQTDKMKRLRAEIVSSWDRVLLLEREDDGWLYGKNENKTIQATFWELRLDQVVKAEVFIAK